MRVLVIEHDRVTVAQIDSVLKSKCFDVYKTNLGEDGVRLAKLYSYDIVVLALQLPCMNGYDVIKELRSAKVDTPIMVISKLASLENKVSALRMGADDYMTKPFHVDEFVARINAVIRRSNEQSCSQIITGRLTVDLEKKVVEVRENEIHMTGKEYQVIELLSIRKGTTITTRMSLDHLYNGMDEPKDKIIEIFTCKIRKKIARVNDGIHYIETVWGQGYVLRDPVIVVA